MSVIAMALLGSTAVGQQLPNVGFEQWKTECGATEAFGYSTGMRIRPGVEPESWNGSSVNQKVYIDKKETLITKVEDKNGGSAANLISKYVGALGIGSNAPGFLTLGTPWVAANIKVANCDGGVYGGITFPYRADAVMLDVKRTDENDEVSTIAAYSWKGTFKSKVGMKDDLKDEREDVDRAIWGTADDANVTAKGETIAKLEKTFKSTTNKDWETIEIPFEYLSSDTPEKFNIIICAGDYWNRDKMLAETNLIVDNVKLVYYSRLASVKVNGVDVEGFDSNKYDYTLSDIEYPGEGSVEATCLGNSGSAISNISYDAENYRVIITVTNTNAGGTDVDGETSHTYTLQFAAPAVNPTGLTYRRKYTDDSKRYYNEISYSVLDANTVVYQTENPTSESYFVTPTPHSWQEEGAYIDFKDKVIEIPANAENFTMILKGLTGTAVQWSQSCVYVDWNNNGSFIDEGETNGVLDKNSKPNNAIIGEGNKDVINIPANVKEGDTFPMLICLTEPKGVDGNQDLWGTGWEWSTEIFSDNVCSLINGQAYELTVKIAAPVAVNHVVTIQQPENGTITVMNGETEIKSGDEVLAGTVLTLSCETAAGYALTQYTLDGQPVEGNTVTVPDADCTISANVAPVDYCAPEGTTSNPNKRGVTSLDVNGTTIQGTGTSSYRSMYSDQTATVVNVNPGDVLSVSVSGAGTWMHPFFYIDYGQDGWTVDTEATKPNGDLVWYQQLAPESKLTGPGVATDYYTMDGTKEGEKCFNVDGQSFTVTIPDNLAPGDYRARYKTDWASSDPCGNPLSSQTIEANAASFIDFTIHVQDEPIIVGRTVTVAVAEGQEALGTVAIEGIEDLTILTADDVVVTATAAEGAKFLGWYNGEELVSTEATYTVSGSEDLTLTANFGWIVTFSAKNGGSLTVKAGETALTSGDAVVPGTAIDITAVPDENKELKSIVVNGSPVEATENVATVTVNEATAIAATFKAIMVNYTATCTGNGKVEAWTAHNSNDDSPVGTEIENGSTIEQGSAINIFMTPGVYGTERETFTAILITNGTDEFTLADKGLDIVAPRYDKSDLVLFTNAKGNVSVSVNFSNELAGITDIFFDGEEGETEYFTLQGVKVAAENLETGFYIARRGNKTIKVYINK